MPNEQPQWLKDYNKWCEEIFKKLAELTKSIPPPTPFKIIPHNNDKEVAEVAEKTLSTMTAEDVKGVVMDILKKTWVKQ